MRLRVLCILVGSFTFHACGDSSSVMSSQKGSGGDPTTGGAGGSGVGIGVGGGAGAGGTTASGGIGGSGGAAGATATARSGSSRGAGGAAAEGGTGGSAGGGGATTNGGAGADGSIVGTPVFGGAGGHCDLFDSQLANIAGCPSTRAPAQCSEDAQYWDCVVGGCGPSFTKCFSVYADRGSACRFVFSGACANVAQCLIGCNCTSSAWGCEAACVQKHVLGNADCLACATQAEICTPRTDCVAPTTCTKPVTTLDAAAADARDAAAIDLGTTIDGATHEVAIAIDATAP